MTYNNTEQSAIGMSPFYANYGYHARWVESIIASEGKEWPSATRRVDDIHDVHHLCVERIAEANRRYAQSHDKGRVQGETYSSGDKVLLSTTHLKSSRPTKKLGEKWAGPFEVIEMIGTHAVRLELPANMRIHPVVSMGSVKREHP